MANPILDFIDAVVRPAQSSEKHLQGKHPQGRHGQRSGAADGGDKKSSPAKEKVTGTQSVGQRLGQAENAFLETIMQKHGFSQEQAGKIFDVYKKEKVVKRDFASGRWTVIHGAFWEKGPMLNALDLAKGKK